MKLKEIKDIKFDIHQLAGSFKGKDVYVTAGDTKIKEIEMLRDSLKVIVVDSHGNEASIHIRALNQKGQNILNKLFISDKIKNMPLEAFEKLDLEYFT